MMSKSERARRASLFAVALAVGLSACGDSTGPTIEVIEDVVFHESLGVDLDAMTRTSSGLYYENLVVGDGAEAVSGSEVAVEYLVRLRTGAFVDSNEGGAPFTFAIDGGGVYEGFNEGVRGMRVGGKRKLVVPPDLVNAATSSGLYGRILVFDVELLEIVEPAA
jgi:hypothetical protein